MIDAKGNSPLPTAAMGFPRKYRPVAGGRGIKGEGGGKVSYVERFSTTIKAKVVAKENDCS